MFYTPEKGNHDVVRLDKVAIVSHIKGFDGFYGFDLITETGYVITSFHFQTKDEAVTERLRVVSMLTASEMH